MPDPVPGDRTVAAASLSHQGRARGQFLAARAVGSYVPKLTRKAFEKYGFSAATLLTDWATIVGEDIARLAAPERLKWPRHPGTHEGVDEGAEGRPGAVLVLRVDPARALDVSYKSRQIIERINGYFGYRAIADLRVMQGPIASTQPHSPTPATRAPVIAACNAPELAAVADERLRAALARLKSGLMRRNQAA